MPCKQYQQEQRCHMRSRLTQTQRHVDVCIVDKSEWLEQISVSRVSMYVHKCVYVYVCVCVFLHVFLILCV